jgi:hypothetical protein
MELAACCPGSRSSFSQGIFVHIIISFRSRLDVKIALFEESHL